MPSVKEIYTFLDALYPRAYSCEWDNDGLMVCTDPAHEVKKVLLTLDVTRSVAEYAAANGVDLIISHHPLIFRRLCAISPEEPRSSLPITLLSSGISVISLHTRFDAGENGMNDTLAELLGLEVVDKFGTDGEMCGRLCKTDMPLASLCNKVKNVLDAPNVSVGMTGKTCKTVAVLGGGGGSFAKAAIAQGIDAFITGECGYNDMIDAADAGLAVITAGHYHTEYLPFVTRMQKLMTENFSPVKTLVWTDAPLGYM